MITITMDRDCEVNVVFKCGTSMAPMLSLGMVGLMVLAYVRRR